MVRHPGWGLAKALLPTADEGQTFLSQVVRTLWSGGVDDVVVVVSSLSGDVERALSEESLSSRLVVNHKPERGPDFIIAYCVSRYR